MECRNRFWNRSIIPGFGNYVGFGINGKMKGGNSAERKVVFNKNYQVGEAEDFQFKKLDAG